MIPFLFELTGGAPDEPDSLDELGRPGPWDLLEELFHFGGKVAHRTEERDGVQVVEGQLGTDPSDATYEERTPLESSSFPAACRVETFGRSLALEWSWDLEQVNVAGRVGFRHRRLLVRFCDATAWSAFEEVWSRVLGRAPSLAPFRIEPSSADGLRARLLSECARHRLGVFNHEQGKYLRKGIGNAEEILRDTAGSNGLEFLTVAYGRVKRRAEAMVSDPDDERSDGCFVSGARLIERAIRRELDASQADEAAIALQEAFPDRAREAIEALSGRFPGPYPEFAFVSLARGLRVRRENADELLLQIERLWRRES